jgi:hypothetical protein
MAEEDDRGETGDKSWHLDKRVNLSIIFAILMQTALALWWASAINTRVDVLERAANTAVGQDSRIVRLETKMDSIFQSLSEIKSLLRMPRQSAP